MAALPVFVVYWALKASVDKYKDSFSPRIALAGSSRMTREASIHTLTITKRELKRLQHKWHNRISDLQRVMIFHRLRDDRAHLIALKEAQVVNQRLVQAIHLVSSLKLQRGSPRRKAAMLAYENMPTGLRDLGYPLPIPPKSAKKLEMVVGDRLQREIIDKVERRLNLVADIYGLDRDHSGIRHALRSDRRCYGGDIPEDLVDPLPLYVKTDAELQPSGDQAEPPAFHA
ncbi:uncharacterized protein L969DRAFT_52878 [Mixia osmundae IAM 14324]|uniref:Uncharacterized protein n=1 Tax=Mixia osmundae (strain CBS 9802 / IAM 14324 / JCM 22182 / KY 12970) TaxID=764103 RepID=G7DS93_MIXOS|nr:uncharacterized protein L969DRAFT_52878 [Mixia osmundae IAM 14324]KEI37494.1 hypothetical protein L969DRAFT_52878 [Mixia osmundae IAM 14324]GAA93453.1 hypothetical protein E5Q_00094 [Mixia osmundae IAM 14324]